ncbi:ATP-dependent Clp protease ATP-binding subunit [Patescibacteria group bacterium]|nr:MAG: ATP-dependent Clp protease ATP-binding subunit [Patescibacteria group bacterium]
MKDITEKFTTHLKNVLTRALVFVVERGNQTVKPEHLLWALGTQKGCIGGELLGRVKVPPEKLRDLVGATGTEGTETAPGAFALKLSESAKRILEKAVLTANVYNHRYIGTEHLLSAILQLKEPALERFFVAERTDLDELRREVTVVLKGSASFPEMMGAVPAAVPETSQEPAAPQEGGESKGRKTPALEYFGRDLTSREVQERIDPVIGRETEIQRMMEILCRRTKNNPLLLGEPGVGKTAIVEGFAKRVMEGDVPPVLRGKRIVSLDLSAVVAGTMYRGEFEGRLRQIMDEARQNPDIILFVDEIHGLVGAGSATGSMDAGNILKPALARGEIRCIGATTSAEYKKHFETDPALERRFGGIRVEEPSPERALAIVLGVLPQYEAFHGVRIAPHAAEAAVRLSVRYLNDRRLPDKAIDLIDEACAGKRVSAPEPGAAEARRLIRARLDAVADEKRTAVVEERFDDAMALKDEEEALRSGLKREEAARGPVLVVDEEDIARVIARSTGIPAADLVEDERAQLLALESTLTERVIGQERCVQAVAQALRRAKAGLSARERPLASFLFLGPSGVGKTELAKAIAQSAFGDERSLIRLDMSEYSEAFTMSKLVGSPAGYVGYREGAKLTDGVKARPYGVVLFDEIEKAHKDVQNLLLQILEEGELADATGRKVSFRHSVIVLTSNVGLERFGRSGMGFVSGEEDARATLEADLKAELNERFRPELVNRIDRVCVFEPLGRDVLARIALRELTKAVVRATERGIALSIGAGVAERLAELSDPKVGARDVRRLVQEAVESKLADRLLSGKSPKRLTVTVKGRDIALTESRRA